MCEGTYHRGQMMCALNNVSLGDDGFKVTYVQRVYA